MFKTYPKVNYDLYSDGSSLELTDITRAVALSKNNLPDDALQYTLYSLDDGERPDVLSYKLYGDTQYYWTFFIINDFLREGYSAWQLSYAQFERLMEREYSRYSAMTAKVLTPETINGNNLLDFSHIPLDDEYLPYLRLIDRSNGIAKIVHFDSARHMLIIEDIHRMNGTTRVEIDRNSFINGSDYFRLAWVGDTAVSAINDLKTQWIDTVYNNIAPIDSRGILLKNKNNTSVENYVMNKEILFDSRTVSANNKIYRWDYYYNAPYQYLDTSGAELSAYDVLVSTSITTPNYKTYRQYEEERNEAKRQLRVIRSEYIRQFSEQYYDTLLS